MAEKALRLGIGSPEAIAESTQALLEKYPELDSPVLGGPLHAPDSVERTGAYYRYLDIHNVMLDGRHSDRSHVAATHTQIGTALKYNNQTLAWFDFGFQPIVAIGPSDTVVQEFQKEGRTPPHPETLKGEHQILPGRSLFVVQDARDHEGRVVNVTVALAAEVMEKSGASPALARWLGRCTYAEYDKSLDLVKLIQWYRKL